MTQPRQQKPDLPELQELAPLIDAGDWTAVDRLLDDDYAKKVAREKVYDGVLENEKRELALNNALLKAVEANRPGTLARVLLLEDFNIVPFMKARRSAAANAQFDVLRVMDVFVEKMPRELSDFFNDTERGIAPVTRSNVQAGRMAGVRRRKGARP